VHISLIGMSNVGKSHWARHIAAKEGYERVDCDTLVEKKLAGELVRLGYKGIHDVAKWMGQPYDPQYPDTCRKYLACEREVMLEIIDRLQGKTAKPLVIDTTGSVIYVGDDVTDQIKKLTRTVYLEASHNHVSKLFERYIANPKPVIWGNSYVPKSGEAPTDTLRRCYPDLLAYRTERYTALAEIRVPFERHKTKGISWPELMSAA
jgi:shikimate kinase